MASWGRGLWIPLRSKSHLVRELFVVLHRHPCVLVQGNLTAIKTAVVCSSLAAVELCSKTTTLGLPLATLVAIHSVVATTHFWIWAKALYFGASPTTPGQEEAPPSGGDTAEGDTAEGDTAEGGAADGETTGGDSVYLFRRGEGGILVRN